MGHIEVAAVSKPTASRLTRRISEARRWCSFPAAMSRRSTRSKVSEPQSASQVDVFACPEADFFRSSATVLCISRESASSDTARASDIAPTRALKVKIALDLARVYPCLAATRQSTQDPP